MKIHAFISLIFLSGHVGSAFGAVTITDPVTRIEFAAAALNTTALSWTFYVEAGSPQSNFPGEVQLSKQGSPTIHTNHLWSDPEPITVGYDLAGNLDVRVGSTTVTIQPTKPFNTILIQIQDGNSGTTSYSNFFFDAVGIRSLFADDPLEMDYAYDHIGFSNLPEVFTLSGEWRMGTGGGDVAFSDSYMKIIGLQIPEPSLACLIALSLPFIWRRGTGRS